MTPRLTDPPAYDKAPNPSPAEIRKQAQQLMNAAENRTTSLNDNDCCARARAADAPDPEPVELSGEGVHFGTINVTTVALTPEEFVEEITKIALLGMFETAPPSLVVELPEDLPEGTEVTPLAFRIKRGEANVKIGYTPVEGGELRWLILSYEHEADATGEHRDPTQPPPFWNDLRTQLFEQPKDAINAAVKWLDALDAWHEVTDEALNLMGGHLENAGISLLPRRGW